jgi:hypothetical protein
MAKFHHKKNYFKILQTIFAYGMFITVENFNIKSKFKTWFERSGMHIVITIELTTIVSSIIIFKFELIFISFKYRFHLII